MESHAVMAEIARLRNGRTLVLPFGIGSDLVFDGGFGLLEKFAVDGPPQ
jgi:hypothetical protein